VSVIFQPVVGRYSEGRDPKKVLALGIAIISVAIASFVLATDFLTLLGSALLLRVGSSFFHPVGVSAVSKEYRGARLGHAMGFQSAFGNLGILLVFVSSAPLYLLLGWKATFLAFALIGVVDVAVTFFIFGTSHWNGRHTGRNQGTDHPARAHQGRFGIPFFFVATCFARTWWSLRGLRVRSSAPSRRADGHALCGRSSCCLLSTSRQRPAYSLSPFSPPASRLSSRHCSSTASPSRRPIP